MSRPMGKLIAAVVGTILTTLMFCALTGTNPFDVNAWVPVPSANDIQSLQGLGDSSAVDSLNAQVQQQQQKQLDSIIENSN